MRFKNTKLYKYSQVIVRIQTSMALCLKGMFYQRTPVCHQSFLLPQVFYMCRAVCGGDLLYSWLFTVKVVNKNSLNYCSSSDKSKRRTKTVKKSLEPKWNQTFMYSPVHRREFRERMLEITLWDQARVREEESEFLGEVRKSEPSSSC